jgi:protein gp37
MGANSSIEWTDHTFNPWWGCVKVSPGCQHCYAETLSKRFGNDIWGPAKTTSRRVFGAKHWAEPFKWDAEAVQAGQRKRVFCASMADVFEAHPMLMDERAKLWVLIESTPNLDWLLLTKRPESIMYMIPDAWASGLPANVWVGTSVEDQQRADERIPELLRVPALVRFLSCEPLLGPLNLDHYLIDDWTRIGDDVHYHEHPALHWVICGGESGPGARPMHPDWARGLRDQCVAAGVAYHFKQWGNWILRDSPDAETGRAFVNVGKHAAGRLLDGRTWDELPEVHGVGTMS